MPSGQVFSGGRITIPLEMRKSMNLKPGDKIQFIKMDGMFYQIDVERNPDVELRPPLKNAGTGS